MAAYTRWTTKVSYSFSALPEAERLAAMHDWETRRAGTLTSNFVEAGCFLRIDSDDEFPNLQHFFRPMLGPDYPEGPRPQHHGLTITCYATRPKSRGQLTLATSNPLDKPKIDPNYLDDQNDVRTLLKGIRWNRSISATKAFAQVLGEELVPGPALQNDEEVIEHIRKTASTSWHPVGTCKMGNDAMAVVDSNLRVCGIESLRVVDASIMPTLVSGNTNAPTMMIAEKASGLILGV